MLTNFEIINKLRFTEILYRIYSIYILEIFDVGSPATNIYLPLTIIYKSIAQS